MNKLNKFGLLFCNYFIVFLVSHLNIITYSFKASAQLVAPLKLDRSDPLIPSGYGRRELSSFEIYRLQQKTIELDKTAKDELDRGNINLARELWYRRLRLTRIIDTQAEVKALGEVGAIAWRENLTKDVQNIASRLDTIQTTEARNKKISSQLLIDLAVAYESVRYLDKAIDIYQRIATEETDRGKAIDKLGQLYLDIFDYDNAAKIYQQKLNRISSKKERATILKTLAEIHDKAQQPDRSVVIKKQLIEYYIDRKEQLEISAWQIAIARDYETLKQLQKAMSAYQQAFNRTIQNQQLASAKDALIGMGKLQQKQANTEQAIDTYNKLITVQQQSDDRYGLVNTYDTLGKIYLKSNKNKAKQFFQQGLNLAVALNYKIRYFRDLLEKLPD